ncbi:MAG: DNA repair and recombination protein RadB [Candidatus Nanohaloarchaea archaeon]
MEVERISTGCESIDKLLNGGIEKRIITNVYGESGTGKTNFCIQIAAQVTENNGKVAFIDSEAGFSPERFLQMTDQENLDNIYLENPTDFEEQQSSIQSLKKLVEDKNIDLIIVDSAVSLYRLQVNGENASEINQKLSQQLSILSKLARKNNIPVIITNQVYTSFDEEELELVGRDVPKYWSKCLLKISKKENKIREIEVDKHRSIKEGEKTQFKITEEGLESVENESLL